MRGSFFFICNSFYFYGHAFLQVVNGEIYFFIYKYCLEQTFSFSDDHKRNITHVADTVNGTFQDGFLIQKFLSPSVHIPAAHFFFQLPSKNSISSSSISKFFLYFVIQQHQNHLCCLCHIGTGIHTAFLNIPMRILFA